MIDLLALLRGVVASALRTGRDLVAENLLRRHQLAVLTRPTRRRPRPARRDRLLWVLARQPVPARRRHVVLVSPDAVVGGTGRAGARPGAGGLARSVAGRA